jgi:hypothetical protein
LFFAPALDNNNNYKYYFKNKWPTQYVMYLFVSDKWQHTLKCQHLLFRLCNRTRLITHHFCPIGKLKCGPKNLAPYCWVSLRSKVKIRILPTSLVKKRKIQMHEALFSRFHSDSGISYIRFRTTRQAKRKSCKGTSSSSQIQLNYWWSRSRWPTYLSIIFLICVHLKCFL